MRAKDLPRVDAFGRRVELCGWCEGTGIVGRVVDYPRRRGVGQRKGAATLLRIGPDVLEVRGEIVDRPCGQCGGTGREGGRA
jgi:hypothetical protein